MSNDDFSTFKYKLIKKSYSKILINCVNKATLDIQPKEIDVLKNLFLSSEIIDFNWDQTSKSIMGENDYNFRVLNNYLLFPHHNINTEEILYPSFSRNFLEFESKKTEEMIEKIDLSQKEKIIIFGLSFNLEDSFILNLIFNSKKHDLENEFEIIIFEYDGDGKKQSNYKSFLCKYIKKNKVKIIKFKTKDEFLRRIQKISN